MTEDSITVQILRDIRDEIKGTNSRIDHLGADLGARVDHLGTRIDETNAGLDVVNARLGVISTTLVEQNAQYLMLSRYAGNSRARFDQELARLDERVTRLEKP